MTQPAMQMELEIPNTWRSPPWVTKYFCRHYSYIMRRADLIHRAEIDGIPHVAPILVAFNGRPDEVRRRIGKGMWRRIHHSSLETNALRARAKLMVKLDFGAIMAIPAGALRETVSQCKTRGLIAVSVAAHIASNRAEMREAVMLARDALRMGGTLNKSWSLRRLREEHDKLSRAAARRRSSPEPFAEPYEAEIDVYHFRRLISPLDFAIEGAEMHHCIASYSDRARDGLETAFSITGNERASVSFSGYGMEIKGRYNRAVGQPCRRAAEAMWRGFKDK